MKHRPKLINLVSNESIWGELYQIKCDTLIQINFNESYVMYYTHVYFGLDQCFVKLKMVSVFSGTDIKGSGIKLKVRVCTI